MPILLTVAIVRLMRVVSDAHAQGPGEFKRTPSLLSTRSFHTATTLADARVLVAGGTGGTFVHRSAEIYDPAPAISLTQARWPSFGSDTLPRL